MLQAKVLPNSLWGEAVNTASYIQNRIPKENRQIPFEMWTGKKEDVWLHSFSTHFKNRNAQIGLQVDKSNLCELLR